MKRPTLSPAAIAAGFSIVPIKVGECYPRNGNLHNPTPRYSYQAVRAGRVLGTYNKAGEAIDLANEIAAESK